VILGRRRFLVAAAGGPIVVAPPGLLWTSGCAPTPPKTPLAHLYGEKWVHGAYELYAGGYQDVQATAEKQSFETYRVLAQKGIVSLGALQTRGVPFHVRVDASAAGFAIERKVPERLTFTSEMSERDREEATQAWGRARDHLHTDYEEIRRLNGSLTTLLRQLQRVRNAIEHGREEQFKIVRKLDALAQGGPPPFQLPYQVAPRDYEGVLVLLLERLEDDGARLRAMEGSIVAVGLVARATDANSGSLAANLNQVLLAVARDAEGVKPRPAAYPLAESERGELAGKGGKLRDQIRASPEYKAWLKRQREKEFEQVGQLLALLDKMTGLPASAIYKQVLDIWSGDADYFSYLKTIAGLVPGGSYVAKIVEQAVDITGKARDVGQLLAGGVSADAAVALASKKGLGVLNTQSKYALDRLDRQLTFFKTPKEAEEVTGAIADIRVLQGALPPVPKGG
jgi:hypothetical protein